MLHAGIVDQNIDGADFRLETVDGLAHRIMIGGIEGERLGTLDSCGGCFQLCLVAAVQHHFGSRLHQALRQRKTDALRRAGDQGAAAGKIEQIKAHCFLQSLDIAFMPVYVIDNIHPFQTWMSRLKRLFPVRNMRAGRLQGGGDAAGGNDWDRDYFVAPFKARYRTGDIYESDCRPRGKGCAHRGAAGGGAGGRRSASSSGSGRDLRQRSSLLQSRRFRRGTASRTNGAGT
ncbi:hypothetical protein AGR1B_Lc30110 [Agrobacterium fabacearum S56]|nr:hypothetical protein AGR1B_Lc30110 [Agrobacterium fabacearum S56]